MFGVWHKDQFVDWWQNEKSDVGWIERMIESMGWEKEDVDVIWYDHRPGPSAVWSFDEKKQIVTHQLESVQRKKKNEKGEETEELETVEVFKTAAKAKKNDPWFAKGERLKGAAKREK